MSREGRVCYFHISLYTIRVKYAIGGCVWVCLCVCVVCVYGVCVCAPSACKELEGGCLWRDVAGVCVQSIEEETDRRVGKDRRCCLWDILECCTSHLAARMI